MDNLLSMILNLIAGINFVIVTDINTSEKDNMKFLQKTEKDKSNWYVMETVVLLLPRAHTP